MGVPHPPNRTSTGLTAEFTAGRLPRHGNRVQTKEPSEDVTKRTAFFSRSGPTSGLLSSHAVAPVTSCNSARTVVLRDSGACVHRKLCSQDVAIVIFLRRPRFNSAYRVLGGVARVEGDGANAPRHATPV